jgi:hypothetical protein
VQPNLENSLTYIKDSLYARYRHEVAVGPIEQRVLHGYLLVKDPSNPFYLNCRAGKVGDKYCILVDAALIATLNDVANGLMQHQLSVFFVGNASLETDGVFDYKEGEETFPGIRMLTNHDKFLAGALEPRCPERRRFAKELAFLMLCVVWNHEFSHVFLSHIDQMQRVSKNGDIWAKHFGYTEPLAWDFEVDADMNAARDLIEEFCIKEKLLEPYFPDSIFDKLDPNLKALTVTIAVLLVLYLWSILDFVYSLNHQSRVHPANGVRAFLTLQAIETKLSESFSADDLQYFRKQVEFANDFYSRAWQVPSLSLKDGWSAENVGTDSMKRLLSLRKTLVLGIQRKI